MSLDVKAEVNKKQTANVIGRLPGSDPALAREAVLYTAHHDHLGMRADAKPGEDAIYNGAVRQRLRRRRVPGHREGPWPRCRSARAAASSSRRWRPRSRACSAPSTSPPISPLPAGRIAANINMDSMGILGRTRDLTMIGLGKSSLDEWILGLAAAAGPHGRARPVPGQGLLLPLRPVRLRAHRRAGGLFRLRHRRDRQARGLGQGAAGGVGGQALPPALRRAAPGVEPRRARSKTPSSTSTSA